MHPDPTPPDARDAAGPAPEPADPRRFLVCGDNPLAVRLVEELSNRHDVRVTVVVRPTDDPWTARIRALPAVEVVEAERLDADAFTRAGLPGAAAVGLVDQDDARTVDAALVAHELDPDVRIVMRMFNLNLGERISQLLNDCVVLSATEIAAPAFVAAALDESTTPPMRIADRTLVATTRERARADAVMMGLAALHSGQPIDPDLLPPGDAEQTADLVLASAAPARPRPAAQRRLQSVSAMSVLFGARLRLVLAVLLAVFVAGTVALWYSTGDLARAAYAAVISELTGANADPNATVTQQVTFTVLTIVSIALIPALTAALVDSTVKARLRSERGELPAGLSDHIVVVGLGHVGTRVVRELVARGMDAVAIEQDATAEGVQSARELGVPVIIGDASREDVLNSAVAARCRALIVASTDDVGNLEISLLARAANPAVRVVLRLFDGEFARRVQRAFAFNGSRSVSYLAAPAFAAAMLGRQVLGTIPVRRRVLIVAELPVRAGSAMEHETVAAVNRPHESRLLAIRTGPGDQVLWLPSEGRRLVRSDTLIVVATRAGLGRLLADTRTPLMPDPPEPDHLLEPWEASRQLAGGAGPAAAEPARTATPGADGTPTDRGCTGPA